MSLEAQDKRALSDIRMSRAYEFLDDGKANYKDKRYKTSVNRSYYAVLNAARAILILQGANPETHEGALTMLNLRFVKPGLLPLEIIKKLKLPAARLGRTGNLHMQGKMHRIRSLIPLPARVGPGWQAAGNALAMHVQLYGGDIRLLSAYDIWYKNKYPLAHAPQVWAMRKEWNL